MSFARLSNYHGMGINPCFVPAPAKLSTDEKQAIHHYARISNIGASTRIENAVLTNTEIEWIDTLLSTDGRPSAFETHKETIENKLSKDKERSIEEVAGCREMLQIIYEQGQRMRPFREAELRQLYTSLLRHYPAASPYLGSYKIAPNSVVSKNKLSGETKSILKTAGPGLQTQMAMQTLISWYNETIEEHPWGLAVAAEFVFRFLAIHPFQDGNGRTGRALYLLAMLQCGNRDLNAVAPYIAIDRHIEQHRQDYYMALKLCSEGQFYEDPKQYKIGYFFRFMISIVEYALKDVMVYHQKHQLVVSLPEKTRTIFECFKSNPQLRLRTGIIVEITGLAERTIRYHLNQLVAKNMIQAQGSGSGKVYQLVF